MTDREALEAMLTRAGVVFSADEGDEEGPALRIEAKDGPKNLGYAGFTAYLFFDANGALTRVGVWE